MTMLRPDDTRAELLEFLADEVRQAKREYPVIGTADRASKWDVRHQHLDALLEDLAELERTPS